MQLWNSYIKNFVSYLKIEKGLSENSCISYQNDVEKLKDFAVDQNLKPNKLKLEDLRRFIGQLYDLGLSARSQARIISGIKQFFTYLLLEGIITENHADLLEQPKIGKKLPDVLSIQEIEGLINAVDLTKKEGQRNRAIVETLYSCGIRVSELIELKLSDLYFDEGFIRVIGKGNKQRLVPTSKQMCKEVDNYIHTTRNQKIKENFSHFLFLNRRGEKMTRVMIFTIVQNLAKKINLGRKISPHTFRHSFATHLIEGGANLRAIQEMLGHESISTTEMYTHLDQRFLKEAILKYHPRNSQTM